MDSGHAAVITARQRFNGVLEDVLNRASDDGRHGHEESDEVARQTAMELLQLPNRTPEASQVSKRSGRSPRKRPRTRDEAKTQTDETYHVMKLFDRSVDLAQFNRETPLYVVCRAWMKNLQPDQPSDRGHDTAGLDLLTCATLGGDPVVFRLPASEPKPTPLAAGGGAIAATSATATAMTGSSAGHHSLTLPAEAKARVDRALYPVCEQSPATTEHAATARASDLLAMNQRRWRGLREERRRHVREDSRRHRESYDVLKQLKEKDLS
ncbi:protein lin-37 homolog [Sycon ciliatum]|uniref:protein lin-37 homolog n=1 Tax=Sycon ciliatum TaxID=27933 RepID=UPI0031F66EE9